MRVNIEDTKITYSTEGYFSEVSKDQTIVDQEVDVFYRDFIVEEKDIPVTIFSQELSPLQAIVKHLKQKDLSYSEIGRLINRNPRTIWATFNQIKDQQLVDIPTQIYIPASIFVDRNVSTLEALVAHLLSKFSVKETASILNKNYQTIWTVKQRLKVKRGDAK